MPDYKAQSQRRAAGDIDRLLAPPRREPQERSRIKAIMLGMLKRQRQQEDRLAKAVVTSSVLGVKDEHLMPLPEGMKIATIDGSIPYGIDPNKLTPEDIEALKAKY